jgi:hypothetical protein
MSRVLSFSTLLMLLFIMSACTNTGDAPVPTVSHDGVEGSSPLVPHPGIVTDDPQGEDPLLGLDGRGLPRVERFFGQPAPERRADRRARNVSMLGHLELDPSGVAVHADVAGYEDLAFVGKWVAPCVGTGVDIIDISDPANPVKLSSTLERTGTSMEDMQAIDIGGRDVLATGLQQCLGFAGENLRGLELYDITDPANPEFLSFFEVGPGVQGHPGVHEFDLTKTPDGRTLALLAVPFLEAFTASPPDFSDGQGEVLILDISDPANPELLADWGVLQEPALGLGFYLSTAQGLDPQVFAHSVRANANGTRAYVSYWDAGFIILDISDPASPVFMGHTEYPPGAEGNAHSVVDVRGGNILVGADEDFSPFRLGFEVTAPAAIAGAYPAAEASFTPPIAEVSMEGALVHVGRGCPPGTPDIDPGGDAYLADPTGKIALIERGACRFDNKVAWAQLQGAVGVVVYDSQPGLILMGGDNPVTAGSGDVIGTLIDIPALAIERSTGLAIIAALDGGETVTIVAEAEFVGWGFLRIFDIRDPSNPVEIGTFATDNTLDPDVATAGVWSVHNPEARGNTLYVSWYSDGVRVIDISQPSRPREIGYWIGEGAPDGAPPVDIWSVVPHRNLLLASDRNHGLYILRTTPPR